MMLFEFQTVDYSIDTALNTCSEYWYILYNSGFSIYSLYHIIYYVMSYDCGYNIMLDAPGMSLHNFHATLLLFYFEILKSSSL